MVMACSRETPLLVPMLREIRGKFVAVTRTLERLCTKVSAKLHWRRASTDQTPTFYPPSMAPTFYPPRDQQECRLSPS